MSQQGAKVIEACASAWLRETKTDLGNDGEIKGPGPFRSMSIMVLNILRDLSRALGPGQQRFSSLFRALSGTTLPDSLYV